MDLKIVFNVYGVFMLNCLFSLMEISFLGTFTLKSGLAQMAKGGVVMDVTNAEQAKIAEQAGV